MIPYKPNKYAQEQDAKGLRRIAEDKKNPISYEEVLRQQKALDLQIEERLKKEALRRLK